MGNVDEIIDYIKSLKKGFDKDLFKSKVDELAHIVDTTGLVYDDFHTLFKVWLNLSIPIQKWVSLGSCLAPQDIVEERTVQYALRWILASYENHQNVTRVAFLLGWLTVAMECDSIDMTALDAGYEVFYTLLTYELLTVHATKLVYTLTKPIDVTRNKALELMDYAKKREGKRSFHGQLQVLLCLFKSYKPECVPEDIPARSVHTAFKKLNENVLARFRKVQNHRNTLRQKRQRLQWCNPINSNNGRKKVEPLVPNLEFNNRGRLLDSAREVPKTFLDFSDPVSLVHHSLHHEMSRPTRVRALLSNEVGMTQLAVMKHSLQGFLAHDLHHLLNYCFLELSPYSYKEKQYFLKRLAVFQRTLVQGLPVITRFLAQYLPLWNEKDYFYEILELVEWVSVECGDQVHEIAAVLGKVYARAQPLEQCAILGALTNMYTNLVYASTKSRQHFLNTLPSRASYTLVLPNLALTIAGMCHKGLQVDPDDMRILYTSVWSAQRRATAELRNGASIGALPSLITLALPLLTVSAVLIDSMAELIILYRKVVSSSKTQNESHIEVLSKYMSDLLNCLYTEEALSRRENGLIFEKFNPELVAKLGCLIPDVDAKLCIKNHLAFATQTYIPMMDQCRHLCDDYNSKVSNKEVFHLFIEQEHTNLGRFLKTALPELRYKY